VEISEITDYQAEAGVVATLVYHPEFILHSNFLHERYFYNQDNACIYWAIKELYRKKITNIDAFNIQNMLNSHAGVQKTIEKYNLPSIQEYIDLCVESKRDTVEEYMMLVSRIVGLSFKRDFYKKTLDWQRMCFNKETSLDTMNNKVYKEINELTIKYVTDGEVKLFGEQIDDLYQKLNDSLQSNGLFGLPSFFPTVSNYFSYEETELIIIEARMKKGKSWLALIEALHKAMNGVPTMLYDSEMSDFNFYIRALSYISGVSVNRIKSNNKTTDEIAKISKANVLFKSLPLYHLYDPYITNERFYSICAQKKIEMGLKFIVWDYIKCDDSILESSKRSAYMAGRTNWLKNTIAGELNLSVLAFCQLNRLNEVAESDGIEKYCSVAVKWEEKTEEEIIRDGSDCGTHKLKVKLNRLGLQHDRENEYIDMMFTKEKVGIIEAKQHEAKTPFD